MLTHVITWKNLHRLLLAAVAIASCQYALAGDLKPNPLFSDHAVLQQGELVPIWGAAHPGTVVTIMLGEHSASAKADADGKWTAELGPLEAGGPYTLTIGSDKEELVVEDVLVGEVWLASGQSNMQWHLFRSNGAKEAVARANYPDMRFYNVRAREAVVPQDEPEGEWIVVNPKDARYLSAVAFYFAESLRTDLKVPVGIIMSAVGGSPAETWTPLEVIDSEPEFVGYASSWRKLLEQYPELSNDPDETIRKWDEAYRKYLKDRSDYRAGKIKEEPQYALPRPLREIISGHYNAMIAPLVPYAIRGVIWYQGEANSNEVPDAKRYAALFSSMIQSWRADWKKPDLPFIFVQLPEFSRGEGWLWVRDSQRRVARTLDNTGMFVAIGYGQLRNIHPPHKEPVGQGLAQIALRMAYGQPGETMGPIANNFTVKDGNVTVYFAHTEGGLVARDKSLPGFEIAGADGNFLPATASISGDTVLLSNEEVDSPKAVRYGFAYEPTLSLYNGSGLPASPFYEGEFF